MAVLYFTSFRTLINTAPGAASTATTAASAFPPPGSRPRYGLVCISPGSLTPSRLPRFLRRSLDCSLRPARSFGHTLANRHGPTETRSVPGKWYSPPEDVYAENGRKSPPVGNSPRSREANVCWSSQPRFPPLSSVCFKTKSF